MIAAIISEAPTPLATNMDITPGGLLPRALQAQLSLPPPPAGVVPPPWPVGALEALVVAARPAATPSGGWNLELDVGGERVQMNSATLLAAGTRVLLRALSPERVRAEQLPGGSAALQPLRNALRSDLPAQLPLREAIGGIATLAADPALPALLRARIVELLAQLPDPARLQQAAGLRAAVLNSGSFLEPRLRAMLGAAAGAALPAAAREASAATTPPATDAGAAPPGTAARATPAAPAHGPRAALAALLRLLVPARQVPASADAAAPASPATAPASVAGARPIPPPLYDAQGALRAGADGAAAAARATGTPAGSTAVASAPAAPSGVASPPAANHAGVLAPPPAAPGLPPAPATRDPGDGAPALAPATAGVGPGTPAAAPRAAAATPGAGSPAAAAQPVPPGASPGVAAMATAVPAPSGAGADNAAPPRPGAATAAGAQPPTGGSDAPARAAASAGIAADLKGRLFVLLEAVSASLGARPDAGRTPPGGGARAPGQPLYTAHGLFADETAPAQSGAVTLPAAEQLVARLARHLAGAEPARGRDHPGEPVDTLLRYVVGALARTRVHQLGVHPENRRQGDSGAIQAWSVEIPIAYAGRLDALEMRVEDHGRREGPRGGAERLWQVLMSVELEQIGPLHALLRLSGTRLATTLWVENPAALAPARDTLAELGDCLRAEGVDVTRLECLPGAPPPRARSHDNLLDVST